VKVYAYALGLALGALPALAAAQNPVSDALRANEQRWARNITAALDLFPADKYGYKPTPAQMSVGAIAVHLVEEGNYMLCSRVSGMAEPQRTHVDTTASKETLMTQLRASFDFCRSSLAGLTDAQMADSVPGFGPRKVVRANMVLATVGDWADHYSQLAIYLRLNGMLPPTARQGM
jgi:hypothetical protein